MSETMSSPSEWVQFYQYNLSGQPQTTPAATIFTSTTTDHRVFDATVVTTAASTQSPRAPGNISPSASGHLSPEGRVSKPIRRRSRASRRTPTTLLNTDTTNFRAMVQQFTGGPTAPFASGSHQYHPSTGTNFNFGLGRTRTQQIVNPRPTAAVMAVPTGYHMQFQQQQQPHQQQQQYQQQHQQYMLSLNNNTHGHGDAFLQRLSNPRPNMEMVEVSDGFAVEGISSHVPPPRSSSSNENRRDNNFMF